MAEPTTDRQTLRREIAKDLGMPFFRRWPSALTVQDTATSGIATASDSTILKDSRFTQRPEFWKNAWVYFPVTGWMRQVKGFVKDQKGIIPEYDFDSAPDTGAAFEIFHIHTPEEIHTAINDAITEGFPAFFDVQTDETIIIEEDKREYELVTSNSDGRGILSNPYRIKSIEMERTGSGGTFIPTSATATTLVNANLDLSNWDTDYRVGVYDGTGSGQFALVSSVDSATGTITIPSMTVTCDTTSEVRYWDIAEERYNWDPFTAIAFDAKDYPSKMYMLENLNQFRGLRMRIKYVGEPQELSADTATTVIPDKYIKHYAIGKLLRQRARRLPGEVEKYAALAALDSQEAERFKVMHSFDLPDQTIWTERQWDNRHHEYFEVDDPLGWGG